MSREIPEIEIEAQLRRSIVDHLRPLGIEFKSTKRGRQNLIPDEDLVVAILKVYAVRRRPADPMRLYRDVLAGRYPLREKPKDPDCVPQVATPRETGALGERAALRQLADPVMRAAFERAQADQPKMISVASNVKPTTFEGRHQGLA